MKINIEDSIEHGVTLPLFKNYFEYAIKYLEEIKEPIHQELIISYVLMTTGLEIYIKSLIFDEYRSKPKLLNSDHEFLKNGIIKKFKEFVIEKKPEAKFIHFDQPYELFTEFTVSIKREFKDLLKWVYELKQVKQFQYHSNLCDFYKLRSLFIHYWEFPLNAQRIDETGKIINFENEFEFKIESLNKEYFIDFLDKVVLFFDYMSNNVDDDIKEKMNNLIDKLKAL